MSRREVLGRIGVLAAFALLIGAVAALLWANLSITPTFLIQPDGHATITDRGLAQIFSATFWYSVIALVGGLCVGVAAWISLRHLGWSIAPLTAGLALVGALACWVLGELVGPGAFAARLAAAETGDAVPTSLRLAAPSALALWVFAAQAIPLFAASLGPEVGPARPVPAPRGDVTEDVGV